MSSSVKPPIPNNEDARLKVLRDLGIDFATPQEELQKLTYVASKIAKTPIALISLVDEDHQKFATNVGWPGVTGTGRNEAFCAHAIMDSAQLVVPDATQDDRFKNNPLVKGTPDIRAYAGSVLEPEDDMRVGTLCVIDTKPRVFSPVVLKQLRCLAETATALLRAHRDRMILGDQLSRDARERAVLREVATRDPLTGLLNQAAFRDRVTLEMSCATGDEMLAVMDVDHFKQVNDRWGHPFGDRYLRLIADCMVATLGENAVAARIGGDEFAILFRGGTRESGLAKLETLRLKLKEACVDLGKPSLGRFSIGFCMSGDASQKTFDSLYQRADIALYATKDRGRNGITGFSHALDAIYNLRSLRARFADALSAGDVVPHYQPKIELATGRIMGFELLARWHHPKRGMLTPADFHRLLTDQAIAPDLTRQMLAQAARALKSWQHRKAPPVRLAINVTHYDLCSSSFIEETDWHLREGGMEWKNITMEVTETAILNEGQADIRNTLQEVRARGCDVALDDFGTGHAGLTHLRDWPIDVLKLDASFVKDIDKNPRDEAIVSTMIDLAGKLGLRVVAEGIERQAIADMLHAMGCDRGQGYLFSKAVDEDRALQMLLDAPWERHDAAKG